MHARIRVYKHTYMHVGLDMHLQQGEFVHNRQVYIVVLVPILSLNVNASYRNVFQVLSGWLLSVTCYKGRLLAEPHTLLQISYS